MAERRQEVQTDKEKTKIVPCTYPECDVDLVVNVFYAPAKARCSAHSSTPTPAIRAITATTRAADAPPPAPNRSLADLRCPLCDSLMTLRSVREATGHMTFVCTSSHGPCAASVDVRPRWGGLEMKEIPPAWADFVAIFNEDVKARAADEKAKAVAKPVAGEQAK